MKTSSLLLGLMLAAAPLGLRAQEHAPATVPQALDSAAAPLTGDAVRSCVECHTQHTAVERTFVQFYPTLLEVARRKGTLKPAFR